MLVAVLASSEYCLDLAVKMLYQTFPVVSNKLSSYCLWSKMTAEGKPYGATQQSTDCQETSLGETEPDLAVMLEW